MFEQLNISSRGTLLTDEIFFKQIINNQSCQTSFVHKDERSLLKCLHSAYKTLQEDDWIVISADMFHEDTRDTAFFLKIVDEIARACLSSEEAEQYLKDTIEKMEGKSNDGTRALQNTIAFMAQREKKILLSLEHFQCVGKCISKYSDLLILRDLDCSIFYVSNILIEYVEKKQYSVEYALGNSTIHGELADTWRQQGYYYLKLREAIENTKP